MVVKPQHIYKSYTLKQITNSAKIEAMHTMKLQVQQNL